MIAILTIIVATTTTATNVKASSNNDNDCAEKSVLAEIACEGQGIYSAYEDGIADGREAATRRR